MTMFYIMKILLSYLYEILSPSDQEISVGWNSVLKSSIHRRKIGDSNIVISGGD